MPLNSVQKSIGYLKARLHQILFPLSLSQVRLKDLHPEPVPLQPQKVRKQQWQEVFPFYLEVPADKLPSGFPQFRYRYSLFPRLLVKLAHSVQWPPSALLQSLICCVSCQEKKAGKIIRQFTNSYILG